MSKQAKQMVTFLGMANSYSFGKGGRLDDHRVHLAKGTFIHAFCYNDIKQQFVVYDDNMNAVEICQGDPDDIKESDLEGKFKPIEHLSLAIKSIDNVCGIGFYYDTSKVISDEVIEKSLKRADNLKKLELVVKERKAKEKDELRARLIVEYDFLERNDEDDYIIVGKNIRTELKRNFPGVKFSVRHWWLTGNDSFEISWHDGPTPKQVKAVVGKYKNSYFDPSDDGCYYRPSVFNELYGGVTNVSTSREITEKAIESMRLKYPDLSDENKRTYHFEEEIANLYTNQPIERILRDLAHAVDFTMINQMEKQAESKSVRKKKECVLYKIIAVSDRLPPKKSKNTN